MNLYTTHAKEFSDSRKYPWNGWKRLDSYLKELGPLRVLDLGCGNGRFLEFLVSQNYQVESYVGLDNSKEMLELAEERISKLEIRNQETRLVQADLNESNWDEKGSSYAPFDKLRMTQALKEHSIRSFNLIVGFGLMHHINNFEARKNIFNYCAELLENNGYLILTFWQFAKLERYKSKLQQIPGEENSYQMSFGKEGTRYCHFYSDEELAHLTHHVVVPPPHDHGEGWGEVGEFYADGREDNENRYLVYRFAK